MMNGETQLVRDLHDRYIRTVDDGDWEAWPSLFTPDGLYRITTRENHDQNLPLSLMECRGHGMMTDRVTGLRRINVYEPHRYSHQISGLAVTPVNDHTVACRSNYLVTRIMTTDGTMTTFSTGVYLDQIVIHDGVALFAERVVVQDSRRVHTLLVLPL